MPGYSPLSDRGNPGLRTGRAYDARKSAPMPYLARNAQSDPAPDDRSTDSEMADPDRGIANTPNRAATGAGSDYTLIHNGLTRHYSLYAPPAYRPGTPAPLLIMLHGGGQRLDRFMQTGMDRVAAANGFIVAYPSGATPDGVKPSWNAGSASPTGYAEQAHVDDVGFIRSMIEQISKKYDIDAKRIYVAGVSKGGMMAYRLACEMSDRIAAIATVAATMTTPQCRPARPVPVLHIHGTEDNNVPLDGGRGEYSARMAHYPSVYDTLKDWRRFNHCSPEHRNYSEGPEGRCEAYEQCQDSASVTLCLIEGGGHVWPGVPATARQERRGQYSSNRFPTNEVIWRFFAQHRRP
ncbi:MAG TPA: PHB depolymerase family esterase [Candidatus Competibacteraceae bacterium]|nr:PHB depolymerase family esterase [Candidatus Competibacteraceae bacterium]